jgi:DNA-directed RNA polymerase subunit RPC12/RpoP
MECGNYPKCLRVWDIPVAHKVGVREFVSKADGYRCPQCGSEFFTGTGLERFDRATAAYMLKHGFSTAAETVFLRKAVGIHRGEFAVHGISSGPGRSGTYTILVRFVIAVAVLQQLKLPIPSYARLLNLVNTEAAPKTIRLRAPARKRRGSG